MQSSQHLFDANPYKASRHIFYCLIFLFHFLVLTLLFFCDRRCGAGTVPAIIVASTVTMVYRVFFISGAETGLGRNFPITLLMR
ncbi:putative membrane protein [Collimonas arenae]|uniref:Putative membrane protein n=1 Tax=Collimonas arenae TaxID=279058 RepID=A0A127QPJ9_9BURK|nr:putative membrane protein [Collimonas arenae]